MVITKYLNFIKLYIIIRGTITQHNLINEITYKKNIYLNNASSHTEDKNVCISVYTYLYTYHMYLYYLCTALKKKSLNIDKCI